MKKFAFAKSIPWAAGGAGLAALENRFVGENLPPELQNVNLGLGTATGAAMALDPAHRFQYLASWPIKSMGLFGIGSMDRFRRAQQSLVDTNLQTARINKDTARTEADSAGDRKALARMFMIPALLGGGGLAYYAWNKRKKMQTGRYKNMSEKGSPHGRQRIRIDVPATALPDDFYHSLINVDDNPKAFTRLQELQEPPPEDAEMIDRAQNNLKVAKFEPTQEARDFIVKWAATLTDDKPSLPGLAGSLAAEFTGLPSLYRATQEIPRSFGQAAGNNFNESSRYGLSGLGNLATGIVGVRTGLMPLMGLALGRRRLGAMTGKVVGSGLTRQVPTLGRMVYRNAFGNKMDPRILSRGGFTGTQLERRQAMGLPLIGARDRALNIANRYDPARFDWNRPTAPGSSAFKNWLVRAPLKPPHTLPGKALSGIRFGANRAVNAGYWAKQLMGRNPNASLALAAAPVAGLGVLHDQEKEQEAKRMMKSVMPDWGTNRGPYHVPVSAGLSAVMQILSGKNPNSTAASQLQGNTVDPWPTFR